MWLIGLWLSECKEREARVFGDVRFFSKACDLGNVETIVRVLVLH